MACGSKEAGGVYRPRHPQGSPFYKLVERFYPQLGGTRTRLAASGHNGNRRRPERRFPPAHPRRERPAKAGPRSSSRCTKRIRSGVPSVVRRCASAPSSSVIRPR